MVMTNNFLIDKEKLIQFKRCIKKTDTEQVI